MGFLVAAAVSSAACSARVSESGPEKRPPDVGGNAGGQAGGLPDGAGSGGTTPSPVDESEPSQLMPLRRLTRFEYDNVIDQLLDVRTTASKTFPGESAGTSGFPTPGLMSESDFTAYQAAAEELARKALERKEPRVLRACAGQPRDDACASAFVKEFGARAFRRPLSDREQATYEGLYTKARNEYGYGFDEAVELVLVHRR